MTARTAAQSPPTARRRIPDDLIIAAWIDVGDLGDEYCEAGTGGECRHPRDLLGEMWAFATRLGRYPDTALFSGTDGRIYAVEGCVFGHLCCRAIGAAPRPGRLRATALSHCLAAAPSDPLGVSDLVCPGILNPETARAVGELKRAIWR